MRSLYRFLVKIFGKERLLGIINFFLLFILKRQDTNFRPGPITIVGMLRAPSGLGRAARLSIAALKKHKLTSFDISNLFTSQFLDIDLPPVIEPGEGGALFIHANPIHLPIILFLIGRKRLAGKKVIGYFLWETTILPKSWAKACQLVHEIYCPSEFCCDVYQKAVGAIPVKLLPHPVTNSKLVKLSRANFNIKEKAVIVLVIADLGSGYERKNLLNTIKIFKTATESRDDVQLVLKISGKNANKQHFQQVEALLDEKILILDKFYSENEIQDLIALADIVCSLHRSEGFGLLLADAMWHKKAIIATGWSGNMTFLPDDCALYVRYNLIGVHDEQGIYDGYGQWADPDCADSVAKLTMLINDSDLRVELGKKAFTHAENYFAIIAKKFDDFCV